jgi:hypothetical protein
MGHAGQLPALSAYNTGGRVPGEKTSYSSIQIKEESRRQDKKLSKFAPVHRRAQGSKPSRLKPMADQDEFCCALYPFSGQRKNDLSFRKGDIIAIVSKKTSNPGWWKGKIGKRVGYLPSNYVELMEEHLEHVKEMRKQHPIEQLGGQDEPYDAYGNRTRKLKELSPAAKSANPRGSGSAPQVQVSDEIVDWCNRNGICEMAESLAERLIEYPEDLLEINAYDLDKWFYRTATPSLAAKLKAAIAALKGAMDPRSVTAVDNYMDSVFDDVMDASNTGRPAAGGPQDDAAGAAVDKYFSALTQDLSGAVKPSADLSSLVRGEGGKGWKNIAFIFIKPHAANKLVAALVERELTKAGVHITNQGELGYQRIDGNQLIDKHYGAIAAKATTLKPTQLSPSIKAKADFKKAFGIEWAAALSAGKVFNASDCCTELGIDTASLDEKWSQLLRGVELIKFGGGFYVGQIDGIFVVNGFYMAMRAKYTTAPAKIQFYVVEWAAHSMSWADFRAKLIGATDPSQAERWSLRGQVYDQWLSLGLEAQPDVGDNSVHASASPFEGLVERLNWVGTELETDTFGEKLLQAGVSKELITQYATDPQVVFDGQKGSLFDLLEDLNADVSCERLGLLQAVAAAQAGEAVSEYVNNLFTDLIGDPSVDNSDAADSGSDVEEDGGMEEDGSVVEEYLGGLFGDVLTLSGTAVGSMGSTRGDETVNAATNADTGRTIDSFLAETFNNVLGGTSSSTDGEALLESSRIVDQFWERLVPAVINAVDNEPQTTGRNSSALSEESGDREAEAAVDAFWGNMASAVAMQGAEEESESEAVAGRWLATAISEVC